MIDLAQKCIEKVYFKKNYEYFKEKSGEKVEYLERLSELIKSMCDDVIVYDAEDDPAIEIWIKYKKYRKNDFIVDYKTVLKISKVADLFVFQHEFSIDNKDPNRIAPVLDGFGGEAYTFSQYELEDIITNFLIDKKLKKLEMSELDEVIPNLEMPEETIFGKNMTLENALFRDLYEICK